MINQQRGIIMESLQSAGGLVGVGEDAKFTTVQSALKESLYQFSMLAKLWQVPPSCFAVYTDVCDAGYSARQCVQHYYGLALEHSNEGIGQERSGP